MSKNIFVDSRTKDHQREVHNMRRFKSKRFLVRSGWMFVGACKRGWYRLRMNLNFWYLRRNDARVLCW